MERLQKILARTGIGSRRACEGLIEAGRVKVNGHVAKLGENAELLTYIALYKPKGVISAVKSPDRRPTVRDLVPVTERIYPVGRLDIDSEGLILLTNDGELTNFLTHPRYGHEKEYRVLISRHPDLDQIEIWRRGVVLEDGYHTQSAKVSIEESLGKQTWLRVVMHEGRKRQIREVGARIGLPVVRIIRVRIGSLRLGNLKPGDWRYLTPSEIAKLTSKSGKVDL
jgi:23S rRNA pseudouridine2605 synthase